MNCLVCGSDGTQLPSRNRRRRFWCPQCLAEFSECSWHKAPILQPYRESGWVFDYSPDTLFVGASHPRGGKMEVCEMSQMLDEARRDELGQAIAEFLNGGRP